MTILAATTLLAVAAAPAGAISNVTPPQITGTPQPGQTLSCSDGSWDTPPLFVVKTWLRDGSATAVVGDTYVVPEADVGHQLTCQVDAADAGACIGPCGSVIANSASVTVEPSPAPSPATPNPPATPPALVAPGPNDCGSLRIFEIRIKQIKGVKYKTVKVSVLGKQMPVKKTNRWRAKVDLLDLPRGEFTIKIVVTTTTGRRITGKRIYHPCHPERLEGRKGRL